MDQEQQIIHSWERNAPQWISLIAQQGIASRKAATNQAIIDAVTALQPSTVLDLGCGEGWLASVLARQGIQMTGTDVVPGLIRHAAEHAPGQFHVAGYADISSGRFRFPHPFDVIVSNFALLGKESVDALLLALLALLNPGGTLLIQTLHPWVRKGVSDYFSGWKKGSWDGLGADFTDPYEWYFRTLEDWHQLLSASGFASVTVQDIRHPQEGTQLSVIFSCREKL